MTLDLLAFIYQTINFGVVLGGLTFLVFKPIQQMLEERATKVKQGQMAAEKAIKAEQDLEVTKAEMLKQAKAEADEIIKQAKKQAKAQADDILEAAKQQATQIAQQAEAKANDTLKDKMAQLRKEFADTVEKVTAMVIKKFDKKTHSSVIDEEIKNLSGVLK